MMVTELRSFSAWLKPLCTTRGLAIQLRKYYMVCLT